MTIPALLQQEHVLTELYEYATASPLSTDAPAMLKVHEYLTACHHLFERGILGHSVYINSPTSPILKSIDKGFSYFDKWLTPKIKEGN